MLRFYQIFVENNSNWANFARMASAKARKTKEKKSKLPLVILFLGVMIVSFTFYFYQVFFAANFLVGQKEPAYLEIPYGMSFQELSKEMERTEMVSDILSFAFVSKVMKYQSNVKSGKFLINPGESNIDMVRKLRSGNQLPVNITFNNVRTKRDLAEKVCKNIALNEETLLNYLNDPEIAANYNKDTTNIVNIFIPNTYELYWNVNVDDLLDRMNLEYERFWNEERVQKAKALGLSRDEVSILASIVQAETNKNDEKGLVAGVYLNRIRKGIPLQADPTLVFALKNFELKRVLNVHKEIDSPYNTYKNRGLPPGPINIPSISSIDGVLNSEKHDYYYFCAKEDFSGYHNFAKTHREHINNANRLHRALNKANIR